MWRARIFVIVVAAKFGSMSDASPTAYESGRAVEEGSAMRSNVAGIFAGSNLRSEARVKAEKAFVRYVRDPANEKRVVTVAWTCELVGIERLLPERAERELCKAWANELMAVERLPTYRVSYGLAVNRVAGRGKNDIHCKRTGRLVAIGRLRKRPNVFERNGTLRDELWMIVARFLDRHEDASPEDCPVRRVFERLRNEHLNIGTMLLQDLRIGDDGRVEIKLR